MKMNNTLLAIALSIGVAVPALASIESKTWKASD